MLTNNHVVEGAERIHGQARRLRDRPTRRRWSAPTRRPIWRCSRSSAPADKLRPLALGDSARIEVGDPVVAIGNPFGLDRTVTSGIVSALQRQIEAPNGFSISDVIQTDAAINPGNSGGPLINAAGEVIGINSQIATGGGGGNVGIGFAIPIDTVRAELRQLEAEGEVEHAFLGISGATITSDLAAALNLPVERGVLVQSVSRTGRPTKPASKAAAPRRRSREPASASAATSSPRSTARRSPVWRRSSSSSTRQAARRRARADAAARRRERDRDRDARGPAGLG